VPADSDAVCAWATNVCRAASEERLLAMMKRCSPACARHHRVGIAAAFLMVGVGRSFGELK